MYLYGSAWLRGRLVPCASEAALFQVNSVTIPADAFIEPVELEIAGVWIRFSKYYR